MKLLVLAAHPDDEILGCGGLLARTVREGGEAAVLIVTEGCSAQYPDEPAMAMKKQDHARAAMVALGGVAVEFLGLPEMSLATTPPARVQRPIQSAVERWQPDWVLVHHDGDLNRDHGTVNEAARVVCRPTPDRRAVRLLTYETLSSTEWGGRPFRPTLFVGLDPEDLERKIAALEAYSSEVRPWPHPRSAQGVESLACRRGAQAGVPLAEAFDTIWEIRRSDACLTAPRT